MQSIAPKFTVFTPTYNRDETLARVFSSLCAQTFIDFEWLIVDDGSTDNTAALVNSWRGNSPFAIRYYYQENKHKKVAFNLAVRNAAGLLFLPLIHVFLMLWSVSGVIGRVFLRRIETATLVYPYFA